MSATPSPTGSQTRPLLFFLVGLLGLAIALVGAGSILRTQQNREITLRRQIDSLRVEIERARAAERESSTSPSAVAGQREGLSEQAIMRLRAAGLTDPVRDIKQDLMKHRELIPYPGVSGGRMGFYDEGRIRFLDDQWVLAYFEDGHVSGRMLLRWRNEGPKIIWTRLDARRD